MTAVGTFRDFVELLKDMAQSIAPQDGRALTPMLHADVGDRLVSVLLDPGLFDSEVKRELIDGFVIPFIAEREATMVAWTFTAAAGDLVIVAIDRERHETWLARTDLPGPLGWRYWPPNEQGGLLLTPIQERLQ